VSVEEAPNAPDRGEVWRRLGAPDEQQGSVNEPRTREEHGRTWNEKWTYLSGGEPGRVVLWNRYDFVGLFRVAADGTLEPEPLPDP